MAEVTHTTFDHDQFEAIYPTGVERHYWNKCRNRVIAHRLRTCGAQGPMLEVGCGKGLLVDHLRTAGFDITGVELADVKPLEHMAAFVRTATDALALDPTYRASVTTILLLDVIEHLEDPVGFITQLKLAFPTLRWLIVTVPARQELFSNFDRFNNHYRRYDPQLLRTHTTASSRDPVHSSYFFHLLYPAARVQLGLAGKRRPGFTVPAKGPSSWAHALIGWFFYLEYRLLPRSLKGTSLICDVRFS
jgi:hypothetical protein